MRNKKRKNTALYLTAIRQAIREGRVWVKCNSGAWDEDNEYHKSYDISFFEDFWCKGSIPTFVKCDEDGKILDFSLGDRYRPQKMTKAANLELLAELDKVIIMYKIGAFQADTEFRDRGLSVGVIRFNGAIDSYEIWNGYNWLEYNKQDQKRQKIREAQFADIPKARKRKHKYR